MVTEQPLGKAAPVGPRCRCELVAGSARWGLPLRCGVRCRATVGWDDKTRERRLHRIVGLNRFRPGIVCRASRVLSLSLRAVGQDFEARYGYRPWLLETFPAHRIGVRAGNRVAETCGRGRQDGAEPVKAMYELEPGCRVVLSARPVAPVGEGFSRECRAENEFGDAPLGDRRLTKRLVDSAHDAAFFLLGGGRWRHGSGDRVIPVDARETSLHAGEYSGSAQGTSGQTRSPVQRH